MKKKIIDFLRNPFVIEVIKESARAALRMIVKKLNGKGKKDGKSNSRKTVRKQLDKNQTG